MGAMMPGLIPPEFEISKEISNTEFELIYKSQRPGLGPMVTGLLEALAIRYGINNLELKEISQESNSCRFLIKWS